MRNTQPYRWLGLLLAVVLASCTTPPPTLNTIRTTTLAGGTIYPADLVLATDDTPRLAYLDGVNRELHVQTAGAYDETVTALDQQPESFGFSFALDTQNNPSIAYVDEEGGDLRYTERIGGQWQSEIVDSAGKVGYFPSLAYDSQGHPHISYFDQTNNDLKYAVRDAVGWQTETIDAYGQPGFHIPDGFTRLALRCLPTPADCTTSQPMVVYFAYRYKPIDGELRVAFRDPQGWSIETIDADRGAGGFPALVLDEQGNPWVSYYRAGTWDFTYGELRLAHRDKNGWQHENVEGGAYVGRGSDLLLIGDNCPVIAYFVGTPGEIRLAWKDHGWSITRLSGAVTTAGWVTVATDTQAQLHVLYADTEAQATRYVVIESPVKKGNSGCEGRSLGG